MLNARERVASALPMLSRARDDRSPPNRSRDTYIPSYRPGRRDDRDRDRHRDHDRRDRYRRDWSPPPRRRDSPDRDRRPPPRGPPRRFVCSTLFTVQRLIFLFRYPSPRRGLCFHLALLTYRSFINQVRTTNRGLVLLLLDEVHLLQEGIDHTQGLAVVALVVHQDRYDVDRVPSPTVLVLAHQSRHATPGVDRVLQPRLSQKVHGHQKLIQRLIFLMPQYLP